MANSSNIVPIMSDHERYDATFAEYCKRCKKDETIKDWINMFFPETIINQMDVKVTGQLKTLGVGSGPGQDESIALKQLLTKWPKIKHTVIEPNKDHLSRFQDLTVKEDRDLADVSFEWHHQTLQQFRRKTSNIRLKYHFIMAFHVLYYFDDLVEVLKYLTSILEDGGKMLVMIEGDNSGMTKVIEKFPQLQHEFRQPLSTRNVEKILTTFKIRFTTYEIKLNLDATGCFDDDSDDSQLLIDFVAHVPYLRKQASETLYDEVIEFLKSDEVSLPKGEDGKLWFKCYYDAIVVTV